MIWGHGSPFSLGKLELGGFIGDLRLRIAGRLATGLQAFWFLKTDCLATGTILVQPAGQVHNDSAISFVPWGDLWLVPAKMSCQAGGVQPLRPAPPLRSPDDASEACDSYEADPENSRTVTLL